MLGLGLRFLNMLGLGLMFSKHIGIREDPTKFEIG